MCAKGTMWEDQYKEVLRKWLITKVENGVRINEPFIFKKDGAPSLRRLFNYQQFV